MKWKLTDLAEAQIEKLKADGIEATPQEVLDIQALSLEAIGDFEDGTRLNGNPVVIGNVVLWPLTIAASIWRMETEAMLSEGDYSTRLFVLAYAMANGHCKEALEGHGRQALKDVRRWAKGLTCNTADLLDAVNDVLGDKPHVEIAKTKPDNREEEATPSYLAQMAMAIFGTDPGIWLYQLSMQDVVSILQKHYALLASTNGKSAPKSADGLRKLAVYVNEIRTSRHG